ncbi:MAG TPA: hypothetical protein VMM16_04170 [Verrucomicrobiae bacterium]|nr:hypothetical protein [Verrucomicrobiae bacterium]
MTTYVLGAGASFHAGYPLACDLGTQLLDWLRPGRLPTDDYRARVEEVFRLYGNLKDIERILTDIEDGGPGSPVAAYFPSQRSLLRASFVVSIAEFFYDISCTHQSLLYSRWARERVRLGDVAITFNYDIACERELKKAGMWEISDGYGFALGLDEIPRSKMKVLKLHGSANWLDLNFGGLQCGSPSSGLGERPVVCDWRQFESLGYSREIRDPECRTASAPVGYPALIMGLHKRFHSDTSFGRERLGFWESLWSQAEEVLAASDEIVVVGYSMPSADSEARSLLLRTANRRASVVVCCGGDSARVCDEFKHRGFSGVHTPGNGFFEDYLERRPDPPA